MTSIGNHMKFSVHKSLRERVRSFYLDVLQCTTMPSPAWIAGKRATALIGDAAACVSLMAGEGAGLAMAEAYVLAGELRNCGGDTSPPSLGIRSV